MLGLGVVLLLLLLLTLPLVLGEMLGLKDTDTDPEPVGMEVMLPPLTVGCTETVREAVPEGDVKPLADCDKLRVLQAVEEVLRLKEGLRERLPVALLEGLAVLVRVAELQAELLGLAVTL